MSTLLGIDVNDYGLQQMKSEGGGSQPVLTTLNVTPSTSSQSISPEQGVDGFSQVNVSAVTSSIDANILPTNIRAGKTILGVQGNLEPDKPDQNKTVNPTTSTQEIIADIGYELGKVTVNGVTSAIDNNIQAGNIKKDVSILGVTGTYEGGGSSSIDWTDIGFNNPPPSIEEGYQQALDILQNWNEYSSVINDFTQPNGIPNERLMFFPSIERYIGQQAGYGVFAGCTGLVEIGQFNTTFTDNSTEEMFSNCKSLRYVPVLPTWTVTNMTNMFEGCTALTDVCLDNIVQMCIHAVNETTKSFANLGFDASEPFGEYVLQYVDENWYGDLENAGWSVY